jgi:hypothetical protein
MLELKIEPDWNAVKQDISGEKREDELTDRQRLEKANQLLKEVQSGGRLNTEAQKSNLDDIIVMVNDLIGDKRSDEDISGQVNEPASRARSDLRNG